MLLLVLLFLLDVLLAGTAQATLTLSFTAATLLGVLLAVCKVVVGHGYSLWKVSLNRVRFMMERPRVSSSVYSISLPTLTPRARMVIFTSG